MTNIELIENILKYRPELWTGENKDIAAHLNKAGVIVPPCKLGDVVFWVNGDKHKYITEHEVIGFIIEKDGIRLDLDDFCPQLGYERLHLTREAAERAMNDER